MAAKAKKKVFARKKTRGSVLTRIGNDKYFIIFILSSLIIASFAAGTYEFGMWMGFAFAAYAAVANDSIQSLGTFIESNRNRPWWVLWLFVGGIFVATISFSYFYYNGDLSYLRLASKNAEGELLFPHPTEFSYFQIIAPIVLLILTRLRMPVSTTFLLLSVFTIDSSGITSVVFKSVSGYILAFILSYCIWYFGYKLIRRHFKTRKTNNGWYVTQWLVSGSLWAVWLMQDGANIAVYLPRGANLEFYQFLIFLTVIVIGLGLLFFLRGDKIQKVVSEKIGMTDVRAATLIDMSYVILLIYKLFISTIPMSTTWVFLGIIGGREIAISLARKKKGKKHRQRALGLVTRDFTYAIFGLLVSVLLAAAANKAIREAAIDFFKTLFLT